MMIESIASSGFIKNGIISANDYRMTFTLRELTGLSITETAELMSVTSSNVKVRLNRAKLMLRKEIEKIYSTADIYEFNLIYCDRIVNAVMKCCEETELWKKH